tara:strand:- start:31 stop:270 length:240 start_codon:yes stop_codon:yes gene_type:complete
MKHTPQNLRVGQAWKMPRDKYPLTILKIERDIVTYSYPYEDGRPNNDRASTGTIARWANAKGTKQVAGSIDIMRPIKMR